VAVVFGAKGKVAPQGQIQEFVLGGVVRIVERLGVVRSFGPWMLRLRLVSRALGF
jgi:hypothetical protein